MESSWERISWRRASRWAISDSRPCGRSSKSIVCMYVYVYSIGECECECEYSNCTENN